MHWLIKRICNLQQQMVIKVLVLLAAHSARAGPARHHASHPANPLSTCKQLMKGAAMPVFAY
jgi:hypothetical protein